MRKSREAAAETRKRIVRAAAQEFRANGIVATGLADLMKAAGLTHGGFYKHFESKDQLVAEATAEAFKTCFEGMTEDAKKGLQGAVAGYLSTGHRDGAADGCPLSAIGNELGRSDEGTRAVATEGFLTFVNIVAGQLGHLPPTEARKRAIVAVCTMVGAMTASRVVNDPKLSDEILRLAVRSVLV